MTQVIGFHYTLKNAAGEVLDSSDGGPAMLYLSGSGQILPALDDVLARLDVGAKEDVVLTAAQGYGAVNQGLKMTVKSSQFPPEADLRVGLEFRINGEAHSPMFRVVNILGEEVFIDGNHPLAGEALHFAIEVTEKRPATKDEIAHGHAHGEGGHHH